MATERDKQDSYRLLAYIYIILAYIIVLLITLFGGAFYPPAQAILLRAFNYANIFLYSIIIFLYLPILIRLNKDREYRLRTIKSINEFFSDWKKDIKTNVNKV